MKILYVGLFCIESLNVENIKKSLEQMAKQHFSPRKKCRKI